MMRTKLKAFLNYTLYRYKRVPGDIEYFNKWYLNTDYGISIVKIRNYHKRKRCKHKRTVTGKSFSRCFNFDNEPTITVCKECGTVLSIINRKG